MNSREYWRRREEEALKHYIKEEAAYDRELKRIYQNMLDSCQKEIESFYAKYAAAEGISISQAKRRISKLDIAAYERKAAKYVKEKNFSKKANEEMRIYNATMKINRLEMLKANIGLETIAGHDEMEKFMAGILKGRTEDELKRQAGILGKTVKNNAQLANAIVNGSFHNGTFSDRIWQYQDLMRQDLGKLLQQGLIQGKGARAIAKDLRKYWYGNDPKTGGGAKYCMERLMRTELARVQTEAQKQAYQKDNVEYYKFMANKNPSRHGTCEICRGLNGKRFKVIDMMPGENAPPMHPHCRCTTVPFVDLAELEAILDYVDQGGTYEEWQKQKKALENSKNGATISSRKHGFQFFAKMPKEKFIEYSLNPNKAPDKAKAFKEALGYTMDNYADLMRNIEEHIDESKFVPKGNNGYGMQYEYILRIKGPNGKSANVLTAWIQDGNEKRLVSVYVTERKVTE